MLEKIRLTVINNLLKFHPVSTQRLVTTHPLELVLSVNSPRIPLLGIQCSACYGGGFWSHASAGEGLSLSLSIYIYVYIYRSSASSSSSSPESTLTKSSGGRLTLTSPLMSTSKETGQREGA